MSNETNTGGELTREEERELVRRAQDGDEQALECLLEAHQDMVFRTALRYLSGREEAACELAQEVLISAFRHIKKFRAESRFSTWLYRITANLAKNRFVVENRERARFTSMDSTASDDDNRRPRDWAGSDPDPRALAEGREGIEILHERLEQLEPEWREVVVLRFFENMSYDEISNVLDIPIGTVKSRINRARRALRELLGDLMTERGL